MGWTQMICVFRRSLLRIQAVHGRISAFLDQQSAKQLFRGWEKVRLAPPSCSIPYHRERRQRFVTNFEGPPEFFCTLLGSHAAKWRELVQKSVECRGR